MLSLIREGKNPLDMPIDELNRELERINEENGVTKEENIPVYLAIREKGRDHTGKNEAVISGMYRLLNQLQSMDGAQIGAVLETGSDVTLGSLLTQGRIKKGNGIDQVIDEEHGFTDVNKTKESISDQIDKGVQAAYYQTMIQEMVQDISPDILQEMTDGEMEAFLVHLLSKCGNRPNRITMVMTAKKNILKSRHRKSVRFLQIVSKCRNTFRI